MAITLHTRVRRRTLAVGIDKVVDDVLGKLGFEVHHIKGNTEGRRDTARVGHVIQRTTGFVPCGGRLWPVPELHGDTNHLITLLVQQRRTDRAIHATTHRYHDTLSHGLYSS